MEMFTPERPNDPVVFRNSRLLLPSVSLGSVPQLSSDLIIHSLPGTKKVGTLSARDHIPFVALQDRSSNIPTSEGLSTPIEVFQIQKQAKNDPDLFVIQQRSPVLKSRKQHFIARIKAFVEEAGFSEVLLLGSIDAGTKTDGALNRDSKLLYVSTSKTEVADGLAQRLSKQCPRHGSSNGRIPLIPAGGLTRRLLENFADRQESKPEVAALLCWASEGDNREMSRTLAQAALEGLETTWNSERAAWIEPLSWQIGSSNDEGMMREIFG